MNENLVYYHYYNDIIYFTIGEHSFIGLLDWTSNSLISMCHETSVTRP